MKVRKAKESDADFFLEVQSYDMVSRFDTYDKEKLAQWFKNNLESHFIIEIDEKTAAIFMAEKIISISVAVKPEFRRNGLATAAINYVSNKFNRKVVAFIDKENTASQLVCKKAGFKKEIFECYSSN